MKIPAPKGGWTALAIAVLILILAAFGITVSTDGSSTVTIQVQGATGPVGVTTTAGAVDAVAGSATHDGMARTGSSEVAIAATEVADDVAASDPLSPLAPLAAPYQRGCRSQFVKSHGSRDGTKPQWIVSHYTVSGNLPGFADINALTAYSNNTQNGVSWHYNVDRDGNCAYTVPETRSAWTQAAANRLSIGIEIINRGRGDAPLFTKAGLKKYAALLSDIARRWNIPIQRGRANKSTCAVIRKGLLDHNDLGACGGNHFDITPYDVDKIIAAVKAYRASTVRYPHVENFGPKRRAWCDRLATVRAHAKEAGWTPRRTAAAQRYKQLIGPGQSRCRR